MLILECQSHSQSSQTLSEHSGQFALLNQLQRITDGVKDAKFFFVLNKKSTLNLCVTTITNIIKLFENKSDLLRTEPFDARVDQDEEMEEFKQ